eukprot:TRINITY_DN4626_c0_g1_i1.p1 TRINITY_DN4626_c0_g1~~TRINITY_DN4626_c0_g1_i1.p1  ORF type:complete len:175 (-),score=40.04 TRINITY_DN4626_c0_g1_i1:129-653(-)
MLWVWNSVNSAWYPGDDYVDVVSFDSYPQDNNHGSAAGTFDALVQLGSNRKIVAMMENGPIPDPDLFDDADVDWACFSTWNGGFLTDGSTNSLTFLKKVYNHDRVITFDELPEWKSYTASFAEQSDSSTSPSDPSASSAGTNNNASGSNNAKIGSAVSLIPGVLSVFIILGLYL